MAVFSKKQLTKKQLTEGCRVVKFGDICQEVKATSKDPEADDLEHYIGLEHLDSGSLRIKRRGSIAEDSPSFTKKFSPGHLLFGKRRCYLKKAAVADFEGICSGDIIIMAPKGDDIVPELLPFIVQSDAFWNWAELTSSGSLSPRTKFKSLAEWEFPLPPVERQKELLKLFQETLTATVQSENLTASIKKLFNATLLENFKPRPHWTTHKLNEIAEIKGGRQRNPDKHSGEHTTPYLRPANIKRGEWRWDDILSMDFTPTEKEIYTLRTGDSLLVEGGESEDVGDAAYWSKGEPSGYCFQNTMIRVRPNDEMISPRGLYWLITYLHRSGKFRGIAAGTKIKHIGTGNTGKIKVTYPAPEELEKLTTALDSIDSMYQQSLGNLTKTKSIYHQILNKCLQG